jgi:peptide/nickel transport system permease protein
MSAVPPILLMEEAGQAGDEPNSSEAFIAESSHRVRDFFEMLAHNRKAAGGLTGLAFFVIIAIIGPWIAPYSATGVNSVPFALPPSSTYWLGTTQLGQDMFSQLIVGTRASVGLALVAGFIATIISCAFGLTAGYLRGIADDILSVITNVFLVIPTLPILIVVAAYANSFGIQGIGLETAIIAATSWAWGARVLRSQMLTLREKDFVLASRVAGESWFRTITDEILPNMVSLVVANFIGASLYALVFSVSLQFLGLGDTSQMSWGYMLYNAQNLGAIFAGQWYAFIPPGLCIGVFGASLAFTNFAIDELTNPRLRTQRVKRPKNLPPKQSRTTQFPVETVGDDAAIA